MLTVELVNKESWSRYVHEVISTLIDSITASIRGYPDMGGDIQVMAAVDEVAKRYENRGRLVEHDRLCGLCHTHVLSAKNPGPFGGVRERCAYGKELLALTQT